MKAEYTAGNPIDTKLVSWKLIVKQSLRIYR